MKISLSLAWCLLLADTHVSSALRLRGVHHDEEDLTLDQDQPEMDPYLQRRRELKIPIGVPVYNPGRCSGRYPRPPTLLPPPNRRRFEVRDGVITNVVSVCYTCDPMTPGADQPDRGDESPADGGIPIDQGPPPSTGGDGGGDSDGGTTSSSGGGSFVSIPSSMPCEERDLMLGCGYDVASGRIPNQWLLEAGITTNQVRLQCICVPRERVPVVSRAEGTNLDDMSQPMLEIQDTEYGFECLLFEEASLIPGGDGTPDRDGTGDAGGGYVPGTVPSGCSHAPSDTCPQGGFPLPDGTPLPQFSNVPCEDTGSRLDHNAACVYQCPDGQQIQCVCGADKTAEGKPEAWYCRQFSWL